MTRWVTLMLFAWLLGAGTAWAQSIDYGAFEELFGEPVTTSATGTPQRRSDVPANMEIITADDIRRSGATDIPGVLAHVVGVDVLRWGTTSADVSIRGYDSPFSPRLLVLVNGRQVYLDDWGRTEWDAIPVQLAEIRQIEIVKGPNTALFGFNAAAGVINIITYNPLYDNINTASVAGGTQGFAQGSAVVTGQFGQLGAIRLSGGGFRSDEFSGLQGIAHQHGLPQDSWQGSASADMHVRIDQDQEFELEATHSGLDHLEVVTPAIPAYGLYDISSLKGAYSASTGIGLLQIVAYSNMLHETGQFAGGFLNGQTVTFDNQKTLVQVQDQFKLGAAHTFRISAEYQRSSMNTAPVGNATVGYEVASMSGMWHWQILPQLSFTEATRIDLLWLSRTGPLAPGIPLADAQWDRQIAEPSYNVALVYQPTELDVLRLSAARGVQLPSLVGFGALQVHLPVGVYTGSPLINPTIVNNYEIDWDRRLVALSATSRFALFYQTSDNLQAITSGIVVPLPSGLLFNTSANIGDSDEIGLELSAKGTLPGGWRWGVGYSPRLVRDHFLPGQTLSQTGTNFADTTPRHVIDVSGGWSAGKWEVDAAARYESSFDGIVGTRASTFALGTIDNYITLDARIAYQIVKNLTFSVVGRSITASNQRQTVIGTVDREVLAMLQAKF